MTHVGVIFLFPVVSAQSVGVILHKHEKGSFLKVIQ